MSTDKGSVEAVPRGLPVSGRFWKTPKDRFRSMIKVKALKPSFETRMKERVDRKRVQELQKEIDDRKKAKKDHVRKRREENEKRRVENERKGEVVSVIKNTAKLRRMKKKQLRNIQKRDATKVVKK